MADDLWFYRRAHDLDTNLAYAMTQVSDDNAELVRTADLGLAAPARITLSIAIAAIGLSA
jgi:hypothetical protein